MHTRWAPPGASHHARMGPLRSFGSRGPSLAFAVALLGCLLLAALPSPASGTYDTPAISGDRNATGNHATVNNANVTSTGCTAGGEEVTYGDWVVDPAVLLAMGARIRPDGTCRISSVTGEVTDVTASLRTATTCSGRMCADLEVGACVHPEPCVTGSYRCGTGTVPVRSRRGKADCVKVRITSWPLVRGAAVWRRLKVHVRVGVNMNS